MCVQINNSLLSQQYSLAIQTTEKKVLNFTCQQYHAMCMLFIINLS